MLIECATITDVRSGSLTLKSQRGSACERCARGEGCGGGVIGRLIYRRQSMLDVAVDDSKTFQVGQTVELSLAPDTLMRLAATMYLWPLLALLIGAALGHGFAGGNAGAMGGAVAGLIGGVWTVRRWLAASAHRMTPSVRARERHA